MASVSTGSGVDKSVVDAVYRQAKNMGASRKVMIALFEACLVESGFRNIAYGDRDSVGVLQQRNNGAWGTYAERMNPAEAARKFLLKAMAWENRYSTPGRLAQAVQVSAFPLRYDAVYPRAMALLNEAESRNGGSTSGNPGRTMEGTPTGPTASPTGLSDLAAKLSDRKTWINLLLILIGVILVLIAIVRMSAESGATKTLAKTAVKVLPQGKAVKVIGKAAKIGKAIK